MPPVKIKIDMALVFAAGVCWSTVGIGVRLIESANVWQILLYRSISLSLFLFVILSFFKKSNPITSILNTGSAGLIGGLALLAAYSGGIYSIQKISVAILTTATMVAMRRREKILMMKKLMAKH